MQTTIAFLVGVIFAVGLGIAGMTQPQKVIGFLDLANWDPSLIFVMIGAIAIHASLYPVIRRRSSPLLEPEWHIPKNNNINPRLLAGAAIFGIGWGLSGYCPGPAVTSLASFQIESIVFVLSMMSGMLLFMIFEKIMLERKKVASE